MFGAFAASTGSLGVTVGNLQRPATVSFGLRASPQLTALFTSAAILFSSAAVNSVRAHEVGHMVPSSRFAASWKPNVAYRALNFAALWKKQTILPSLLAYAGIPYQVFGDRSGALALMIAWSLSAIFASTSRSPAALSLSARASAFSSLARSFIAACSSAVNPSYFLLVTVVPLVAVLLSATTKHLLRTAQRFSGIHGRGHLHPRGCLLPLALLLLPGLSSPAGLGCRHIGTSRPVSAMTELDREV